MVPGMTERERLAADVTRLDWLADARFGPANIPTPPPKGEKPSSPLGIWRRGLTAALLFGQRFSQQPQSVDPLSRSADARLAPAGSSSSQV